MKRWQYYLLKLKRYSMLFLIFTTLLIFTGCTLNNIFGDNQITGETIANIVNPEPSNQITGNAVSNIPKEDNPITETTPNNVGCKYGNPICESGYRCVDNKCQDNRHSNGGGGGGGYVPPITDAGAY